MLVRLAVVLAVIATFAAARYVYGKWQRGLQSETRPHPKMPAEVVDGAYRTWVVFTTPLCASCGPARDHLAASDPNARIVTIDATRRPELADAFHVRSVPTVLLADATGDVHERLVGASAVRDYAAALRA
jgi:hypothetical protein